MALISRESGINWPIDVRFALDQLHDCRWISELVQLRFGKCCLCE